jgi:hypothetical protein
VLKERDPYYMKRDYIQYITSLAVTLAGLTALLTNPQITSAAARDGIDLCIRIIIPSIFPFLVFSSLVVDLGFAEIIGKVFKKYNASFI